MHTNLPRRQSHSRFLPQESTDNVHDDWEDIAPLQPFSRSSSLSSNRTPTTTRPRPLPPPPAQSLAAASRLYSQSVSRYRASRLEDAYEDSWNDPDSHYFQNGFGQLNDAGDASEEEDLVPLSVDGIDAASLSLSDSEPTHPVTQQERERLEWQALLTSVLSGDVLKSEKTRIGDTLDSSGGQPNLAPLWLAIRAKFHGLSLEEEQKTLDERRLRTVDGIINEILSFRVSETQPSTNATAVAFEEATTVLRRLEIVQSLYPSLSAFYRDKPLGAEPAFQSRCDALNTWYNVHTTLKHHFALLRRWTGSDTLDVNQPYTNHEGNLPSWSGDMIDGTTFVERLLKEESMQLTFEKGFLITVHNFLGATRDAQVNLSSLFKEMNLPTFEKELVPLISFPTKLAQAGLRLRLDYMQKLKEPDIMIIDQMTEDLKLSIGLACSLKRQYQAILAPDPGGNWNLPQCINEDYDRTILEALTDFFKLLQWKLKSGSKTILLKETDVLEGQWETFDDVSATTAGGSSLVAEQLCSLTNKLMVRETNYFEAQIRVPMDQSAEQFQHCTQLRIDPEFNPNLTPTTHDPEPSRKMTDEQTVSWYSKILASFRLRHRKLLRFAGFLTQRFSSSAEYSLDDIPLDEFITLLASSDHFLVYTNFLEEEGIYIVASSSLYGQTEFIRKILDDAFPVSVDTSNPDPEFPGYILILSPQTHFLWTGRIMVINIPHIPLDLKDNRVLLIADGRHPRLNIGKQLFAQAMEPVDEEGESLPIALSLPCVVEAEAHLANVNRELRKITRATNRLVESIVDSVHHVRSSLHPIEGRQEVLANWYVFAAEHGQKVPPYTDRQSLIRFNRLLIKLAISWVSFICDDCDPNDGKTFKWAVNALEYTLHRTKRYILHLPDEEFEMLRQKVASCMTLLISHFDILGAKSISKARQDRERQQALLRLQFSDSAGTDDDFPIFYSQEADAFLDPKSRLLWERICGAIREVEDSMSVTGTQQRTLGKVLNEEIPEDRSLSFLASSSSNISIRWQQGKFIGAGAFGSVYLALNLDNGSLMAVKEIKFQEMSGLPTLIKQIKEELSVMEMLHHPNVVEYYGIEVHRDKVYIFEEYCQGGSLAGLLEHGRIEDEGIIQVYTMQMLEGLSYLHSHGIVHRDIKPDNILLDHKGVIKFVDFGAAKILAKNQRSIQKSRRPPDLFTGTSGLPVMSNGLTGTPMYMSPEIIKNDKRGRHGAMDIWSMGCVVLEFATGKRPWSNLDNEWAIMFHIGVATQHPPLPEPDQLSELGTTFIKQCLTIDPIRRPAATELMNHPWMLEFRQTLMRYGDLELTSEMAEDRNYGSTSVARQASTVVEEQEIEQMPMTMSVPKSPTPPLE